MVMCANGLAKLIEECGKLQQIAAKKLAYFEIDQHPDGKGDMQIRMAEEIADVMAACDLVIATFGLDYQFIEERYVRKLAQFWVWHEEE